jgi:hypothetical protein
MSALMSSSVLRAKATEPTPTTQRIGVRRASTQAPNYHVLRWRGSEVSDLQRGQGAA